MQGLSELQVILSASDVQYLVTNFKKLLLTTTFKYWLKTYFFTLNFKL